MPNKERSSTALMGELAALLVAVCSVAIGLFAGVSWLGLFGEVLLAIVVLGKHLPQARNFSAALRWLGVLAAVFCAWVPAGFILVAETRYPSVEHYWRHFYALLAWWLLLAVLAASQFARAPAKSKWVLPALGSALLCAGVWIASSYWGDYRIPFYLALIAFLALLVLCGLWLNLPQGVQQALMTAILLIVLLPVANLLFDRMSPRATLSPSSVKSGSKYWTYSAARRDPRAYERWWANFSAQCQHMFASIVVEDPETKMPLRLRPNSHALVGECQVSVNHLGFRGPEIPDAKGDAYRIVAIGESTTFGFTTTGKGDKPWPEWLEQFIQTRLKPARPVQVLNAGIPSVDLPQNLRRLPTEILPLKPDMLISYHGVNGFHLLAAGIPVTYGKAAPNFCERPFRLLAECEYRLKLSFYRRSLAGKASDAPPSPAELLKTPYAESYRQLIQLARTNRIHLVLGNFSMAVNPANPPDEVQFFRSLAPSTLADIRGNTLHSQLIQELGSLNPDIRLVNTHPGLDGNPEMFLDLVHFTGNGERQLAENFFAGIRDILEHDLRDQGKPD